VTADVFERCDANTMTVFDTALTEARGLGHDYVGTEHLLLALVRHRYLLPAAVAALLPRDLGALAAALNEILGAPSSRPHPEGGHAPRDAELLKRLGIDLEQVRAAVRNTFGDDAVERLRRPVHQPWQPWRRPSRRCMSLLAGTMGVAPRAKQAFDRARQDADRRQRPMIDPAGLLLGMVEVEGALSNRLLHDAGVDPSDVRRALLDASL
jgi:ATP-dependent Clp protease ATP-binding subunit ClpA